MAADADSEHDNFSSVSWSEHAADQANIQSPSSDDAGKPILGAGAEILAGGLAEGHIMGGERLDCTVGSAIKENDGTKDAFISYQITTHVSFIIAFRPFFLLYRH